MASPINGLTDDVVLHLRRVVKSGNAESYLTYARRHGVTKSTIGKSIRGDTFGHLNGVEPPFRKVTPREKRAKIVRRLYRNGMAQDKIATKLKMSKTTVELLCKDIVAQRQREIEQKKENARALYIAGDLGNQAIADQIGITTNLLQQWVKGMRDQRVKIPKMYKPRAIKAKLSPVPYPDHYVYHFKNDGHDRVRLVHKDTNVNTTMVLRDYVMSVHLGRLLNPDEIVMRIDGTNDELSNLRLMTTTHSVNKSRHTGGDRYICVCSICEEEFIGHKVDDDLCTKIQCTNIVNDLG